MYRRSTITQAFEPGSTRSSCACSCVGAGQGKDHADHALPRAERDPHQQRDHQRLAQAPDLRDDGGRHSGPFVQHWHGAVLGKLSDTDRYDFISQLGLGKKIDIGLNGASADLLAQPQDWERRRS